MIEAKNNPLRLAIVGCGSVSERFHVPALRGFDRFAPTLMLDHQQSRAELLANLFPGAKAVTDVAALTGAADAAIIALPSHLNSRVATQVLGLGVSVLVEKPAALTVADAQMLAAASSSAARLAVGFIRREAVGVQAARDCIRSGLLGEIREVSIEDGYLFSWNAVNEFRFDPARGGGILLDIGSHVLDMLTFWFGDVQVTRYQDDNTGGVETNASIELATSSGIPCRVELSWSRELRNSARIVGSNAILEIEWYTNRTRLCLANGLHSITGSLQGDNRLHGGAESFPPMFLAQLQRWHASLGGDAAADTILADGSAALRNVELIARCRELREPITQPWRVKA